MRGRLQRRHDEPSAPPHWDDLLKARSSRTSRTSPRARPRPHRCPTTCIRACASCCRSTRSTPTSARPRTPRARRAPDARDGHRVGEVARVQPARARHDRARAQGRALYLYPTKALAQDQARALAELHAPNVRAAIYDGDTPGERRWQIRKWANVILTNPDMLHVGVLPHHDRWGDVLAQPALHRHRRGPRLPRRVRLARRQRSAPPAPARPGLRRRAAVPDGIGDDRQPRRAGAASLPESKRPSSTPTRRLERSARSCSGTRSCWTPSSACARARSATRRS